MQQPVPSPPGSERASDAVASASSPLPSLIASYQADVDRRLEDGLRSIETTAAALMREIAGAVYRSATSERDAIRATIAEELSGSEAIRGLLGHSDERFQALAARTARLEETVDAVAGSIKDVNTRLGEGVAVLAKLGAGSTGGIPKEDAVALRQQLAAVTRQVAAALDALAERDQAIVDSVRERITEHGDLIAKETSRISGAMEGYVQQGVQAMGQLAGAVEAQVGTLAARDAELEERVTAAFDVQVRAVAEQLEIVSERLSSETMSLNEAIAGFGERSEERMRSVGEYLHLMNDRIGLAALEQGADVKRVVDERVMGLAKMVRSDAEALRAELVRVAAEQDVKVARTLDERLDQVTNAVGAATSTITDELAARMHLQITEAIRARLEEFASRLEARSEQQVQAIDDRMSAAAMTIEARVGDSLMEIERRVAATSESIDGVTAAVSSVTHGVDDRIAALARLVRSDNETLAQQIVADQDASKQALRAMKELQAILPNEVIEMVEQRFASLAESIERSNEMLAKRIDRMAETIGAQHETDIQVVVDRMGDAMHALASLGRPTTQPGSRTMTEPRLDLD
jgi:DNA anti-recombination protein RmuC